MSCVRTWLQTCVRSDEELSLHKLGSICRIRSRVRLRTYPQRILLPCQISLLRSLAIVQGPSQPAAIRMLLVLDTALQLERAPLPVHMTTCVCLSFSSRLSVQASLSGTSLLSTTQADKSYHGHACSSSATPPLCTMLAGCRLSPPDEAFKQDLLVGAPPPAPAMRCPPPSRLPKCTCSRAPCPAQQLPIPIQLPSRLPQAPCSTAPTPLVQQPCNRGLIVPLLDTVSRSCTTTTTTTTTTTVSSTSTSSTSTSGKVGLPTRSRPAAGLQRGLNTGSRPAFTVYCSKQERKSGPGLAKQAKPSSDCSSRGGRGGSGGRQRIESVPDRRQQQEAVQEARPPVVLRLPAGLHVNGVHIPLLDMAAVAEQQRLDKEEQERLEEEEKNRLQEEKLMAAQMGFRFHES